MDQPPRRSLRKTTSAANTSRQPEPQDDGLALTEDDIRARSIRRTTREPERGVAAQVAGSVGSVAVGATEAVLNRILKLVRLPVAILIGLWVVFTFSGVIGIIAGLVVAFLVAAVLSAVVNWLDLRAYRRQMR